jgi:alcohol dehydrogenase
MIANVDTYRKKADLHLELLWDRNIAITTRLVSTSTILMLFNTVSSHKIDPKLLDTRRFKSDKILDAYKTFGNAARNQCNQNHH